MDSQTNSSDQQIQSLIGAEHGDAAAKMVIGPLEYIVLSVEDDQFEQVVLPELQALHDNGDVHVVDLLFAQKNDDGTLMIHEVPDLDPQVTQRYGAMADSLTGLLTPEDIAQLVSMAPPDTGVAIILFEHTWTLALTDAVHKVGGQFFGGGMVAPDVVNQVVAELLVKENDHG